MFIKNLFKYFIIPILLSQYFTIKNLNIIFNNILNSFLNIYILIFLELIVLIFICTINNLSKYLNYYFMFIQIRKLILINSYNFFY